MPREKESTIKLPSLDDLFSSQEERDDAKLKRIYETESLRLLSSGKSVMGDMRCCPGTAE